MHDMRKRSIRHTRMGNLQRTRKMHTRPMKWHTKNTKQLAQDAEKQRMVNFSVGIVELKSTTAQNSDHTKRKTK